MLDISHLTVKSGSKTWLDDVSLTAAARRITGVVGPRGSGKTELARAIVGLIEPAAGTISLEGEELGFGDRQNFGYLPAERGGYPNMKVLDQIVFFARLHGMTMGAAERNAITLLARLDLSDRGYAPLSQLSGTEAARVDIAALLAADPDVVVLDEPFDGLDAVSAELVFDLLRDHADSGVPVLFTTDRWELAQSAADDFAILSHGTIAEAGTLAQLQRGGVECRAEFESGARAKKAAAQIPSARAEGAHVAFPAADAAAAAALIARQSGVLSFETTGPDLAELFKERV
ncbi:ATP-binding cassette domain-containing protein [Brevibacterium sp. 5221]|uniref:ATP-binding cassette domain-containing protein n=1 Tax=Brevibacterium rongguiense TaxID=2695267 RepID=A0A6N9H3Z1_9MICO|nr:ATP-binding cassette domain-containing protein [Brevibacterium rongguiense]MYM18768.1 ATP-binding cassette domain-containing protein [Brevibacterium rongguiense]